MRDGPWAIAAFRVTVVGWGGMMRPGGAEWWSESAKVTEGSRDGVVHVLAVGNGEDDTGPGGWGALLKYGERSRGLSGFGMETTATLMTFTAVVEALECLTRPVRVRVWCDDEGVPEFAAGTEQGPDAELQRRLLAMVAKHRVEWIDDLDDLSEDADDEEYFLDEYEMPDENHPYERVHDLAYDALVRAEALVREQEPEPVGRPAKVSLDTALQRFLAGERARLPRRAYEEVESVLGTLRWSIGWYSGKKPGAARASRIADYLPDFYYVIVHKKFASVEELDAIGSVLRNLVAHLQATGQISAKTARVVTDDFTERLADFTAVRKFVDALRAHLTFDAPESDLSDIPFEDRVTDQYVDIAKVTKTSITFKNDPGGATIGPVTLPADVCALARPGWQILLTAARINGHWTLCQVVNGDP